MRKGERQEHIGVRAAVRVRCRSIMTDRQTDRQTDMLFFWTSFLGWEGPSALGFVPLVEQLLSLVLPGGAQQGLGGEASLDGESCGLLWSCVG